MYCSLYYNILDCYYSLFLQYEEFTNNLLEVVHIFCRTYTRTQVPTNSTFNKAIGNFVIINIYKSFGTDFVNNSMHQKEADMYFSDDFKKHNVALVIVISEYSIFDLIFLCFLIYYRCLISAKRIYFGGIIT